MLPQATSFYIDDSYDKLLMYPGEVVIDKKNLDSFKDNYFILEFLEDVIFLPKDSW